MSAFYKSKFEGPCALETCGKMIEVGDPIVWNPKVKPVQYYHLDCMERIKVARDAAGIPAKKAGVGVGWTTAPGANTAGIKIGTRCRFYDESRWISGTIRGVEGTDGGRLTVARDDGKSGGGLRVEEPPYNGKKGWVVSWGGSNWNYKLEIEGVKRDGKPVPPLEEPETEWMPAMGDLEAGMKVKGSGSTSGQPSEYEGEVSELFGEGGCLASVKRDDNGRHWNVARKADGSWGADGMTGTLSASVASAPASGAGGGESVSGGMGEGAPADGGAGESEKPGEEKEKPEESALKKLAEALQPYLESGTDEAAVKKIIGDALTPAMKVVDEALADIKEIAKKAADGGGVLTIEIKKEGKKEVKRMDGVHKDFDTLLKLIQVGDHVYMWGPPGSGKSTAARQVSEALSIEFGYISLNPQTPDSRILGYLDAGGHYRSTVFRHMYENGGVMCIDEMDNAAPSLCVTINSGLESDLMAFPDRMVKRSPKFVLVATGNTTGRGANPAFPERRPFDSAFAERFSFLEWDYDHKLERAIALGLNTKAADWVDWVLKIRAFCKKNYPRVIVSPRASFKGAKLLGKFKEADIAEMVLFKGLDRDTVKAILEGGGVTWPRR